MRIIYIVLSYGLFENSIEILESKFVFHVFVQ